MIRSTTLLAAAATLALVPSLPAFAQRTDSQEVTQLKSKDTPDLASGMAYIVYETLEDKYDVFFMRSLTPEELERFLENRRDAIAEERADMREDRDGAPGVSDEELLPDAAFSYVDRDIRNLVRLDSGRVFEKDGERRTYVVEVPPGEYTIFGAGIDGMASGTCMCMGSVRFEAKAGELTDLGAVLIAPEDGDTDIAELQPYRSPEYIRRKALPYVMSVRPASPGDTLPGSLADMDAVPATYHAADRFPNFLGMLINRMPPIEGVLRYDADRVIDLAGMRADEPADGMGRTGGVSAQTQVQADAVDADTQVEGALR
ncbi:hypothetical protein [Erythrobacter sp.]|uniref:hypothetical protein n=1 Tax=Erythrobacter sp. TaxID=1042 RepID=UPI003C760578